MSLNHTSSISGAPAAAHPSGIPHSPTVPGVPGAPLSFGERARQFHHRVFVDYWPYWAACLAAAVLNIVLLAYWGSAWGVTGELTRWGGHIVTALGIDAKSWPYFQEIGLEGSPLQRTSGYLTIGMLGGALVGALVSGNFRIRMPQQRRRLVQGFVGGLLSGFGARLAMGCNLGSFFSAIPQFSLHGWLFMLGLFPGTYLGVKLAVHPWVMGPATRRPAAGRRRAAPSTRWQPYAGAAVAAFIGLGAWKASLVEPAFGVLLLFGTGFGFIIQRGRICFTAAFREMWITRQGELARALALGMAVSTLGFAALISRGIGGNMQVASLGVLVGGILFGIGIVLAGGCESGWMYRSMEGYVQLWMAGLGTITGATLLAWAWHGLGLYDLLVAGWPAINLVDAWGWPGAIFGTLALLAAWYALVTWWESLPSRPASTPAHAPGPARKAPAFAGGAPQPAPRQRIP